MSESTGSKPFPNGSHRARRLLGSRPMERTDWFWLAYLIFFLIAPVERRSLVYWAECLAILSVFFVLYVGYFRADRPHRRLIIVAMMAALGAAVMPMNPGSCSFLIYASAFVPYALTSIPWTLALVSGISAILGGEMWALHLSGFAIFLNVFFSLLAGGSNVLFAQKERDDCKLRLAHEEIEALAAMAERERIARDLHDVLGHALSLIVLKSELAGRLIDHSLSAGDTARLERARAELADVERTGRTALAEVREAIGGYRARGLAAEIEAARRTLDAAGVTLEAEAPADLTQRAATLTPAQETVLSLALREAVTNIVRHAQAQRCRLRFVRDAGGVCRLWIEDDGRHPVAREGNGLRGMRERVESIGGQLQLSREAGTKLLIELPVPAPQAS